MRRRDSMRALLLVAVPSLGRAAGGDVRITVGDAWIREAPPGMTMMAGYMSLRNDSQRQHILIGATSRVFGGVMIHRTMDQGGMTSMVHASQVELAANASLLFAPGGLHLMLMDPKRALRAGERVEINLEFRGGLVVLSEFEVRR